MTNKLRLACQPGTTFIIKYGARLEYPARLQTTWDTFNTSNLSYLYFQFTCEHFSIKLQSDFLKRILRAWSASFLEQCTSEASALEPR